MDNRPIGFFDSGLGGLTSVQELHEKFPNEKVLYFGDTARTPYGSKSSDTIIEFATQIVDYLVSKNVKMIIIACNTVTALALGSLRKKYPDVPIYGVIGPTVRKVVSDGRKNVGIIATKATISSNAYSSKLEELDPTIKTYSLACPAFVPLIEEGFTNTHIMEELVKYYLDDFVKENNFDSLVLGCTHYPLISEQINQLYPQLNLYNSSAEVVNELGEYLSQNDMLAENNSFRDRYYASDLSDNFIAMTELLFKDRDSKIKLVKFDD